MAVARSGRYAPVGYVQLTSLAAAANITIPAGADQRAMCALVQAESQNVRWRDDGTNPTASVGSRLLAGADMWYEGNLNALRFIEETASAKVNVTLYESIVGGL